ncbi:RidA family protein [Roseovarius sp. S4756]|uniref:RidA family protein n=1 Tax=Roseovarius maritimus TaxID=3342637 RepID=UPI0037274CB4
MKPIRIAPGARMSQAVVHGDLVWLSGQIGAPQNDLETQTRDCLAKVEALLEAAGSGKSHIIKMEIWLADLADFDAMNAIYETWVDRENPPARATCEARVRADGTLIEMVATASLI